MFLKHFPIVACVLLIFCWLPVVAEEAVVLDAPTSVKVGDPLIITAGQSDITWSILPTNWNRIAYPNANQVALDTSKSGVVSVVITDAKGVLITHRQIVVGDGGPNPSPGPDPDPLPIIKELWGIVLYRVHDVDDAGPEQAQVLLGVRLRTLDERFTWMPNNLTTIDETGEVPDGLAPWLEELEDKELETPHLFLVDQEGNLRYNSVLPQTVDEVITLVRELLPL